MMSRMPENPILYKYKQYIIDKRLGRVNSDFKNIGINGENDMDEIIPNLWLGNYKAAYNYKKLINNNIRNVINICDNVETPFKNDGITYLHIPVKDRELSNKFFINGVNVKEYMYAQLTRAILMIFDSLNNNEGILVHCKKGASRSACIVKYFLMIYYDFDSQKAIDFIKNKRPIAFPREKNIMMFEKKLIENKQKFKQYFNTNKRNRF